MTPGRLDGLTKELIALAVSATNGCTYCIRSQRLQRASSAWTTARSAS